MQYVTEGYLGTSHRVHLDAAAASFVAALTKSFC